MAGAAPTGATARSGTTGADIAGSGQVPIFKNLAIQTRKQSFEM
jgi:hypothetical protein